jgi:Arc/MetJ-type ribon-helix-helix transcriptional regulator
MDWLRRLRNSGRFNSYSEIIKYGLKLVVRELEIQELAPNSESTLANVYRQLSKADCDLDSKLSNASLQRSQTDFG